ncbi:MAG: hypothetical protein EAX95_16260 [Candidatus Thorarchaeota archaeon]|nr:hypothetical protein [Candidatus Thorarchaeota archaeon]
MIEGLRYGSNPLLEMRIHDINLEVDLSRHDPNHPGEKQDFDGTGYPDSKQISDTDTDLIAANEEVSFYWTGPWPLLHYVFGILICPESVPEGHPAKPAEGTTLHYHIAKNLLSQTESWDIHTEDDGSFGQPSDEILNQQVGFLGDVLVLVLIGALIGLEIAMHHGNIPMMVAMILDIVIASVTFFEMYDWFHEKMLSEGKWTHYECAHHWFILGLGLLCSTLGPFIIFGLVNFYEPMTPAAQVLADTAGEMAPVQAIAMDMKLAIIFLIAMAVACFYRAFLHLVRSF